MTVADVGDELAWMPEMALADPRAQSSRQFDPAVVVGLEALVEGLDLPPPAGTSVTGFTMK